ncbi:hypothetical protein [Celerinatantimonas sp. YJH-8]|uniref:hypothetical protein n=1 Tax=Celerinatantimonas sp. YJH-8 TaxID=3228714 RepID=UPI0038CA4800
MTWKETCVMDLKIQLIADWLSGHYSKRLLSSTVFHQSSYGRSMDCPISISGPVQTGHQRLKNPIHLPSFPKEKQSLAGAQQKNPSISIEGFVQESQNNFHSIAT